MDKEKVAIIRAELEAKLAELKAEITLDSVA